MRFVDIIGQEAVIRKLRDSVLSGRIPHAQLFVGMEGSGALPIALAYAQYVGCKKRNEKDSCGVCPSCVKHQKFSHPDVRFSYPVIKKGTEEALATDFVREWMAALSENPYLSYLDWLAKMDAGNKQGNIPVSECRAIMGALSLKPFESEYKMLILWLPEFLGNEGNILLKVIEEPPQKTLFLLVAEQMDQILPTILSRTQLVRVPPIEGQDLSSALEQRFSLDKARAETLAYVSDGSYRRALELLGEVDQPLLQPFRQWLLMCFSGNKAAQNLWVTDTAGSGREEIKALLGYGLHVLRMCLVYPELGEKARLGEAEQDFISKLSRQFNPNTIEKAYKLFNDSMYQIERNGQAKLVLADLSNEMHKVFSQK